LKFGFGGFHAGVCGRSIVGSNIETTTYKIHKQLLAFHFELTPRASHPG
jgi:hypothetical protein